MHPGRSASFGMVVVACFLVLIGSDTNQGNPSDDVAIYVCPGMFRQTRTYELA